MAGTPAQSPTSPAVTPRCIVLCAEAPPPAELVGGLDKRGMRVIDAAHPAGVMLALARHDAATVVVVEPARVSQLQPLLSAIRRYYPQAGVWTYGTIDAAVGPRLVKLDAPRAPAETPPRAARLAPSAPAAAPPAPPSAAPRNGSGGRHAEPRQRRLVPAAAAAPSHAPPRGDEAPDDRDEPLISREELTMLLADDEPARAEERER